MHRSTGSGLVSKWTFKHPGEMSTGSRCRSGTQSRSPSGKSTFKLILKRVSLLPTNPFQMGQKYKAKELQNGKSTFKWNFIFFFAMKICLNHLICFFKLPQTRLRIPAFCLRFLWSTARKWNTVNWTASLNALTMIMNKKCVRLREFQIQD